MYAERTVSCWAGQAHQQFTVDVTNTTLKPQHFVTLIRAQNIFGFDYPIEDSDNYEPYANISLCIIYFRLNAYEFAGGNVFSSYTILLNYFFLL